jgi:hypothetical protein
MAGNERPGALERPYLTGWFKARVCHSKEFFWFDAIGAHDQATTAGEPLPIGRLGVTGVRGRFPAARAVALSGRVRHIDSVISTILHSPVTTAPPCEHEVLPKLRRPVGYLVCAVLDLSAAVRGTASWSAEPAGHRRTFGWPTRRRSRSPVWSSRPSWALAYWFARHLAACSAAT